MKPSNAVLVLAALIALLATVAAGAGLLWPGGGEPFPFITVRGETVTIHGQGLYRYDTVFTAAGNRGTDMLILGLAVPLLVAAALSYRRGSLRGALFLLGVLAYVLYVYGSYAVGTTAYNALFLIYVALFAASLYAFVLLFAAIGLQGVVPIGAQTLPRRGPAALMFVAGLVTVVVWGWPIVEAMTGRGVPQALGPYATLVTHALDMAIIAPAAFLSAVLILRGDGRGYLVAFPLLGILLFLGPAIALQTLFQVRAGVVFRPGEIVGPIAGFMVVAILAVWVMVAVLRRMPDTVTRA